MMKRLLVSSLSFLLLCSVASSAHAQTPTATAPSQQTTVSANSIHSFTPFQLVHFAYRGSLGQQGVPGYSLLLSELRFGRTTAESLVKAGITAGRVSPDAISDREYLNGVASQLKLLDTL
ncbi:MULTISPECIES: hypothetical protein [Nostocales]|uniref:SLH domain-containing protein n=3 Tax=Nostocales TaxID=1161 RepID=A0A8S9T5M9_9CYAN|nr:hypothetical protein [Tolypothrix bouteillei]KAF3887426.1 hypothetical protein DA73_0400019480 [Tolypothrix bouteillei VB521301]